MDDARNTKKIYQSKLGLHKKGPKGRPVVKWKYDVENEIRKMGIVTGEALILHG
jgi:hypothetical protein